MHLVLLFVLPAPTSFRKYYFFGLFEKKKHLSNLTNNVAKLLDHIVTRLSNKMILGSKTSPTYKP